jgi:hypothetical protein
MRAPSTSVGRVLAEEVKVTPYFLASDQAFWGSPFLLVFTRVHGKKPSEKPHEQAKRSSSARKARAPSTDTRRGEGRGVNQSRPSFCDRVFS